MMGSGVRRLRDRDMMALALDKGTPKSQLDRLARNCNQPEILRALYRRGDTSLKMLLVSNPIVPPDLMMKLATAHALEMRAP